MHIPIFRVFYSTSYTVLILLTIALLLITPGDGIFQSYKNKQRWNIVIIAATYFLTIVLTAFIYATRIYTTRTHLASIPQSYIPIRKGDLKKSIRKVITDGLNRSAAIAYNVHPRDLKEDENSTPAEIEVLGAPVQNLSASPNRLPPWGIVAHPGWSSPSSEDLPNVHYDPVLLELPHLIEAKAVSLAPPDPLSESTHLVTPEATVFPDPVAVAILQRPASHTLRDYLERLSSLSMLPESELLPKFIAQYERARFSTTPLSEMAFRSLMSTFSSLLRSLTLPDPELLASAAADSSSVTSSTPSSTRPSSVRSSSYAESVIQHLDRRTPTPLGTGPLGNTPFFTPYPASFSSNDGDRDDSGSERTAHTAWTGPGQRSASRYTATSEAWKTPRMGSAGRSRNREDERLATRDSVDSEDGSVIRRIITSSSAKSGVSDRSVIVRRPRGDRSMNNDGQGLGIK